MNKIEQYKHNENNELIYAKVYERGDEDGFYAIGEITVQKGYKLPNCVKSEFSGIPFKNHILMMEDYYLIYENVNGIFKGVIKGEDINKYYTKVDTETNNARLRELELDLKYHEEELKELNITKVQYAETLKYLNQDIQENLTEIDESEGYIKRVKYNIEMLQSGFTEYTNIYSGKFFIKKEIGSIFYECVNCNNLTNKVLISYSVLINEYIKVD